jgi:hypothetical protein
VKGGGVDLRAKTTVITDIQPYYPLRSGRGELTRYEKLTLTFSEYQFNGSQSVPAQLISLITAPLTRAAR